MDEGHAPRRLTPLERKRSVPQTIMLNSTRQMLAKFNREIGRLERAETSDACLDHSFNCVLTAMHVLEWFERDLRIVAKHDAGFAPKTKREVRELVRTRVTDWPIVETLANASKHAGRPRDGIDLAAFSIGLGSGFGEWADWKEDDDLSIFPDQRVAWVTDLLVDGKRIGTSYQIFVRVYVHWMKLYAQFAQQIDEARRREDAR